MRKKKLYPILTALILVIFFSMPLSYMGCKEQPSLMEMGQKEAKEELDRIESERAVEEQASEEKYKEVVESEEEVLVEGEAVAEKEEKSIPNEPITYSTSKDGFTVIIVVNFKTTEVTGSLSLSGKNYIDATITDGKIDINTFEITANYSGTMGSSDTDYPFNGTIAGKITEDLSTLNGFIRDDGGESTEFIAKKETAQ